MELNTININIQHLSSRINNICDDIIKIKKDVANTKNQKYSLQKDLSEIMFGYRNKNKHRNRHRNRNRNRHRHRHRHRYHGCDSDSESESESDNDSNSESESEKSLLAEIFADFVGDKKKDQKEYKEALKLYKEKFKENYDYTVKIFKNHNKLHDDLHPVMQKVGNENKIPPPEMAFHLFAMAINITVSQNEDVDKFIENSIDLNDLIAMLVIKGDLSYDED